jgi:hypothetical protein
VRLGSHDDSQAFLMADTSAVKGESYLPKAVPEGEWAITVIDVDDEFVYVIRHHVTRGVVGSRVSAQPVGLRGAARPLLPPARVAR